MILISVLRCSCVCRVLNVQPSLWFVFVHTLKGMALIHWAADRGASEALVALLDAGAQLHLQVLPGLLRHIIATHDEMRHS